MIEKTLQGKAGLQLSGNVLKILAAIAMTLDHAGLVLFPRLSALRFVGRLAFPIFAFMIAEGCVHTRSRARYFLSVLALAAVCQVAYTLAMDSWYLCAPVSFSLAIPLVLALESWKKAQTRLTKLGWAAVFLGGVAAVWMLTRFVQLDYGFWGCMLPVGASLFRATKRWDKNTVHVLAMAVFMVPLAVAMGQWQWWSFLSLPLLKVYSGRRGKYKMKYFFYIFYPAHLLVIQGINMLLT